MEKEKKNLMIWVTYHKDSQIEEYGLREDKTHTLFASHKEVEGKNINHMNPVYSEMVTMWYVWKNNIKSSLVGFEHYRRHLDTVRPLRKGECQVYRIVDFLFETVYDQYARCHKREDIDVMLQCVERRYGTDNPYTRNIRECHTLIANCTFVMRWQDFTKMCQFLFPLLDDFADACGISNTSVEEWRKKAVRDFGESEKTDYQTRILSFLAERLISAWIMTHLLPFVDERIVAIVNYNTPVLLEKAILSLRKNSPGCQVVVLDNSDKEPFRKKMAGVEVIDNTKGQVIDFAKWIEEFPDREPSPKNDYGSAKHSYSIQWLIDHIGKPFVVMDSDVLVRHSILSLYETEFVFAGSIGEDTFCQGFPIYRVLPILCYLNVPLMKEHGVTFFNRKKMWNLVSTQPEDHYDTGAWLLEDVREKNLPYKKIDLQHYVEHMWHGSWANDAEKEEKWLKEREALWK